MRAHRTILATLAPLVLACTQTHVVLMFGDAGELPDTSVDTDGLPGPATVVSIASSPTCAVAAGALCRWLHPEQLPQSITRPSAHRRPDGRAGTT